jgi:hypothetical protein
MFLFHSLLSGSLRQKAARSVFALLVLSFLFTALLFTGCNTDGNPDPGYELDSRLIGTWTSTYDDGYAITSTRLTYYGYGDTISYAGNIRAVTTSGTAGVIIFEYDADKKPEYQNYDSNWQPIGDPYPPPGNFIGVYYEELKSGVSVQMGTAYVDGGAEEKTLDAAKKAFTLGKKGDYIFSLGTYLTK